MNEALPVTAQAASEGLPARRPPSFDRRGDNAGTAGMLILDRAGRVRFCGLDMPRLTGCRSEDMIGRPVSDLFPDLPAADDPSLCGPAWSRLAEAGPLSLPMLTAGGEGRMVEVRCHAPEGLGDELKVLEVRCHWPPSAEDDWNKLMRVAARSADAVMITGVDGLIEYVNPAFETASGCGAIDVIGYPPGLDMDGFPRGETWNILRGRLLGGATQRGVLVSCGRHDAAAYLEMDVRPYVDAGGKVSRFVYTGRGASELARALEGLARAATHDPLTELPNRRLFLDRYDQALHNAHRLGSGFTLAFLDVDGLKAINDGHGHMAGDLLLQTLAGRLQHCIREVDTVARLGGDEFGLILANAGDSPAAAKVFDKILHALREPVGIEGALIQVRVSIGAFLCPVPGVDPRAHLKDADAAMYEAKRAGGNHYRFHPYRTSREGGKPPVKGAAGRMRPASSPGQVHGHERQAGQAAPGTTAWTSASGCVLPPG